MSVPYTNPETGLMLLGHKAKTKIALQREPQSQICLSHVRRYINLLP